MKPGSLLPVYPEQERQDDADEKHGCDGKIDFQIGLVDENITGQPSDGQFCQKGPEKPGQNEKNTDCNEQFLHNVPFPSV